MSTVQPVPVVELDDADLARRFGGLERLYGVPGAARIRDAHVLVAGIGGVGSWAVEALARSGVGRLTLIDLDHIAEGYAAMDERRAIKALVKVSELAPQPAV